MIYALIILWFGFWSAGAGGSIPWLKKLLDEGADWLSESPEFIIALSIANVAVYGWDTPAGWVTWLVFALSAVVAYAGKQSGTWAYLNWEGFNKDVNKDGVVDEKDGRDSTLRRINDWISNMFKYKLGDEGYSWVWAGVKGFIQTLPVGGTGALFLPLGHEVGSHAKGRLNNWNMYKEFSAGAIGIGIPCVILLLMGL